MGKQRECEKNYLINHEFQLVLTDSVGAFIEGTEFYVKAKIIINNYGKGINNVTINLPAINFQIVDEFGGYINTISNFLPSCLRPVSTVMQSILAPSYNGQLDAFSFIDPLPTPIIGYIVSINNSGALSIQAPGEFGNFIPQGSQSLLPSTISYIAEQADGLCDNLKLSDGATNITGFTGASLDNGLRDSHVNDAFDNVVAWTWQDNSMIPDKPNGTTNVMVAVGKTVNGKIKNVTVTQLTDFTLPVRTPFDTSVAINRTNKNNIVVSWGLKVQDFPAPATFSPFKTYSFDGGQTWSVPDVIDPNIQFSDCEGVKSDKYGNIWYGLSARTVVNNYRPPVFYVSTDGGISFTLIYTAAAVPLPDNYDYPQYCFGTNELGVYGLYFVCAYSARIAGTGIFPFVGFFEIPQTGPVFVPSESTGYVLYSFTNQMRISDITASNDGRLWFYGPNTLSIGIVGGVNVIYKSPGAITDNYSGPWLNSIIKLPFSPNLFASQPFRGYIPTSIKSVIYDNNLNALYALCIQSSPDFSQNMKLNFFISRNNGETWSDPFEISNTDFANRGFQSMALDPITGNLVFGWYDGRDDPSFESLEYYSAIIPHKKLRKLVKKISYSNPILITGPATIPDVPADKNIVRKLRQFSFDGGMNKEQINNNE